MNSAATDAARAKRPFWARLWRPRGLFFKIFGWFLAAQLLIALALYALAATTQRGFDQRFSEMIGVNLEARARAAAIAYENGGAAALSEAWQSARPAPPDAVGPPRFDEPGDAPPVGRVGRGGFGFGRGRFRRGANRRALNDLQESSLFVLRAGKTPASLVAQHLIGPIAPARQFSLPNGSQTFPETFSGEGGATYLIRRVETAHGGQYLGVLRLRLRGDGPGRTLDNWLGGGPGAPAAPWRFAVVALTMGALCYALARYLTDPAIKLRRATRQFAAGDFAVRVGPQMGARRDELADLGRDFDQMAERIEGLLLSQRQLLGDISHELRSPLTRLSLALELAAQSADAPTRPFLTRIEAEIGEMNRLIGQLLTIAKLENGANSSHQDSREAAYIDLAGLVEHVAQNADFEAKSRGGNVKITELAACQIVGNGELLHSALENVVRNAILHSPGAPRVEISLQIETKKSAQIAMIRVRDHGPGVPAEALERLFQPFFRVDAARDRQSGGTGLGLSIAQRAARFHGGEVRAQNAPGGGLEVEISLPVAAQLDADAGEE